MKKELIFIWYAQVHLREVLLRLYKYSVYMKEGLNPSWLNPVTSDQIIKD